MNFCTKRINRSGETKQVSVSEVTPGNGVTSDTIKNPIEILIGNFHDFSKLKVWRSMLFFLYETDVETTKILISKPFPEISVLF